MGRHRLPEDLAAELELVDLVAIVDRRERQLIGRARELVDERRLTVETVAEILGVSERTAARRLARASQEGQGRPKAVPEGRER